MKTQFAPDYGTIYVNENSVKDLPNWKPGEVYEFTVKAELTELGLEEYANDPKDNGKMRGRFKIKKVTNAK